MTPTRYPGVYTKELKDKKWRGRPDLSFSIAYRIGKRQLWEVVGRVSEGMSAGLAAELRAKRISESRDSGVKKKRTLMTFDEAWIQYRDQHLKYTRSLKRIEDMYTSRVKPVFGNFELGSIRRVDIESFMGKCKSEGLAPATIRHFLSILSAVYHKMRDWEMYDGPIPTESIPKPRQDNRRMRFFTQAQIGKLLPALAAKSKQLHDIAKLSLHTGMRAKEIFSLMGEHVDLEQGTVRIVDPKDMTSSDVLPLTKTARSLLAEQKPQPGVPVFRNRYGEKIDNVSDTFKRVVEDLGFNKGMDDRRDKLVFHSLRHTFASWMAINGESIYTIQQLMRHKSAQMTQRYSHLSNSAKSEAMDRFEDVFSGKKKGKKTVSGKRRAKVGQ